MERHYGVVRGWRAWQLVKSNRDWWLRSMVMQYNWKPGVSSSREGGEYLLEGGGEYLLPWRWPYGFYSFRRLDRVLEEYYIDETPTTRSGKPKRGKWVWFPWFDRGVVDDERRYAVGSILCWGRVMEGDYGFRAEKAKPEYIVFGDTWKGEKIDKGLLRVAEKYEMTPVSRSVANCMESGLISY